MKNALLADGDRPEPRARIIGEEQVTAEADRLVANTPTEAPRPDRPLPAPTRAGWPWSSPASIWTASPRPQGPVCRPGGRPGRGSACRRDGHLVAFVGRIQPLKAPDVLLRAVAELRARDPELAGR